MKPIIGGPDTSKSQAPRATSGGVKEAKPGSYSPPKGPIGQMRQGPGLHGDNLGSCGTQGKRK